MYMYVLDVSHIKHQQKNANNIRKSNSFLQKDRFLFQPPQSPPARLPALVLLLPGREKHEDAVEPWDQNPSWERGKTWAGGGGEESFVSAILRGGSSWVLLEVVCFWKWEFWADGFVGDMTMQKQTFEDVSPI